MFFRQNPDNIPSDPERSGISYPVNERSGYDLSVLIALSLRNVNKSESKPSDQTTDSKSKKCEDR